MLGLAGVFIASEGVAFVVFFLRGMMSNERVSSFMASKF
jgi:hypothetical protein